MGTIRPLGQIGPITTTKGNDYFMGPIGRIGRIGPITNAQRLIAHLQHQYVNLHLLVARCNSYLQGYIFDLQCCNSCLQRATPVCNVATPVCSVQLLFAMLQILFAMLQIPFVRLQIPFVMLQLLFAMLQIQYAMLQLLFAILHIQFVNPQHPFATLRAPRHSLSPNPRQPPLRSRSTPPLLVKSA